MILQASRGKSEPTATNLGSLYIIHRMGSGDLVGVSGDLNAGVLVARLGYSRVHPGERIATLLGVLNDIRICANSDYYSRRAV